jgi:hypothetical protein
MDIISTMFKPDQKDLNALGIKGNANAPGPLDTMLQGVNPMEMIPGANSQTSQDGMKLLDAFVKLLTSPQGAQGVPDPGESRGPHPYQPGSGKAAFSGREGDPQSWQDLFKMYPEAMQDTDLGISIRERFHNRMQELGRVGPRGSYSGNAQNKFTTMEM